MKLLHLFIGANTGGIESLFKDYAIYSVNENIFLLLWGEGPLVDNLKQMGVKVINLHGSSKKIIKIISGFLDVCESENIDAVIAHHASPISHLCLLAVKRMKPRIKTIAYAHGTAVNMVRNQEKKGLLFRKVILKLSLNKADAVIAISDSVKQSLVQYFGTRGERLRVIYNGVDIDRFNIPLHKPEHITKIIFVGRLIEMKGVQVILHALSMMPSKMEWEFWIVGDGPYRRELEKLKKKLGLLKKVIFLGNRSDVPQLLSESDVFCHACVGEEGFGIGLVEAMAAGKLCIGTNRGAIPEIITDRVDGYLVPSEDAEALCGILERLINEKGSWKEIQLRAKEKAKKFNIHKFVDSLDMLVKEVAES